MTWFEILTYALMAPVVAAVVLNEAMRVRLRKHHPDLWVEIGRPKLLDGSKVGQFVRSGGDRTVSDPTVVQLGLAIRIVRWFFFLVGGIWWILAVAVRPAVGLPVTILCLAMAGLIHVLNRRRRGAA